MTSPKRLVTRAEDLFVNYVHRTVQSADLLREPPNIEQWLQRQLVHCAGWSDSAVVAILKYRRKYRLKLDWSDTTGESAIIAAWKCGQHDIVKRLRRRGAQTIRIDILEAIRERKEVYCCLMIEDLPRDVRLFPELEEAIVCSTISVTDMIIKRPLMLEDLELGSKGVMWKRLKRLSMNARLDVASEFVNTMVTHFQLLFGNTFARKKLIHLSLQCCFVKLAALLIRRKYLPALSMLMEDIAVLDWKSCTWVGKIMEQLYSHNILQPHFLAHQEIKDGRSRRLLGRQQSLAMQSTFHESCCTPLLEAIKHNNLDMFDLIIRSDQIDFSTIFDRLAEKHTTRLPMCLIQHSFDCCCAVEQCWENLAVDKGLAITTRLLEHGLIPDVCYVGGRNIIELSVSKAKNNRFFNTVLIGGCWNPDRIYSTVTLDFGIKVVGSIVCSAKQSISTINSFLDAGLNPNMENIPYEYRKYIEDYLKLSGVRSLRSSCRISIRRQLCAAVNGVRPRSMYQNVNKLPLPAILKSFLLLQI